MAISTAEGRQSLATLSQAEAAGKLSVSITSIKSAKAVRENAIPAIVMAVGQGVMPVSQAAQVAGLPEAAQRRVASRLGNGQSVSTIVLAATWTEKAAGIERESTAQSLALLGRTFPWPGLGACTGISNCAGRTR